MSLAVLAEPSEAQANEFQWTFENRGTPTLRYRIASIDYVQLKAACAGPGSATILIAADTGDLAEGARVPLRFYGPAQQTIPAAVSISGADEGIYGATVSLPLNHPLWTTLRSATHIDYQLQNNAAARLVLNSGHASIDGFIAACGGAPKPAPGVAAATSPNASSRNATPPGATSRSASGGISEKDAFEYTRQLDTPEAYRAFLSVYPKGFFAEIAKGMLARKEAGGPVAPSRSATRSPATQPSATQPPVAAQPPSLAAAPSSRAPSLTNPSPGSTMPSLTAPPTRGSADVALTRPPRTPQAREETPEAAPITPLEPFTSEPGTSAWRVGEYVFADGETKTQAAIVTGEGAEFVTYCSADDGMQALIRRTGDGYPKFGERVKQGVAAKSDFDFSVSGGEDYTLPVTIYGSGDEFGVSRPLPSDGDFYRDLIKGRSFTVNGQPFGATFQLKGSRAALCEVMNACSVNAPACGAQPQTASTNTAPATRSTTRSAPRTQRVQCRSRSTYVEGRGCVLNRYLNRSQRRSAGRTARRSRGTSRNPLPRSQRCKARSVWIAGRGCVRRRSVKRFSR